MPPDCVNFSGVDLRVFRAGLNKGEESVQPAQPSIGRLVYASRFVNLECGGARLPDLPDGFVIADGHERAGLPGRLRS
jgi:hypothetical protein